MSVILYRLKAINIVLDQAINFTAWTSSRAWYISQISLQTFLNVTDLDLELYYNSKYVIVLNYIVT